MAQTISICDVYNNEYEVTGIECCIPDEEEVEFVAISNELYGDVTCEYRAYNIGEGESGVDYFFENEEIIEIYKSVDCDSDKFEKEIEKRGYEISCYSSGTIRVYVKDYNEEFE